jgi:hypothetical protein
VPQDITEIPATDLKVLLADAPNVLAMAMNNHVVRSEEEFNVFAKRAGPDHLVTLERGPR